MDTLVELKAIHKSYPNTQALKAVDFKLSAQSIHGLVGPNGAGKSTLMRIVAGILRPDSGSRIVKGTMAFLPESLGLYPEMTVENYIKFLIQIHHPQLKSPGAFEIMELMEKFDLRAMAERKIAELSKGFKQRVALCATLGYGAQVIILDEPFIGLDPTAIKTFKSLIKLYQKEHSFLISSHQLRELEELCDQVSFIERGEMIRTGSVKDVVFRDQTLKVEFSLDVKGEALSEGLEKKFSHCKVTSSSEQSWNVSGLKNEKEMSELLKWLIEQGHHVQEFKQESAHLDGLFHGGGHRD